MKIIIGKPFDAGIGCVEPILGCIILFLLAFAATKMNYLNIKIQMNLFTKQK